MQLMCLTHINKTYRLGKTCVNALVDVSIEIASGEFISIAGKSGSGKTTLLNIMGCLDSPDSGQYHLNNVDLTSTTEFHRTMVRRAEMGFIFQTFNLIPVLSVYENVEYPLVLQNWSGVRRRRAVLSWLEQVGLAERRFCRPNELSGGQRQRVAIARALVKNPTVVLADEPTASLDSTTGQEIITLMVELNKTYGTTFLVSSHDPSVIELADRVIRITDGRLVS